MRARIFLPPKNAMQSGRAGTDWVLVHTSDAPNKADRLMGWIGGGDTQAQVKLIFASKDEAIAYAEKVLGATDVTLPKAIEESVASFGNITRYEGLLMTEQVVRDNIDQVNSWARDGYYGGLKITRADFDAAVGVSQRARATLATVFDDYDVLITPGATGEAPADLTLIEGGSFNSLWTHMYVPCLTIPAFVGPNGMPVGLQVVGPHGADEAVLAAGAWIEAQLKATNALPIHVG